MVKLAVAAACNKRLAIIKPGALRSCNQRGQSPRAPEVLGAPEALRKKYYIERIYF
jgi:hypothetical protein